MAAANLPMLLAGRILQGAGAGCGVVLARAIARDVYGPDRVAQVIAYLTAAYVLGPMVAPPIGGQLLQLPHLRRRAQSGASAAVTVLRSTGTAQLH